MLRSILLALDDTEGAIAARDYALALARHTGAALTAAVILDRRDLTDAHEAVPPGAAAFKERRDAALLRQAQEAGAAAVKCLECLPHLVAAVDARPPPHRCLGKPRPDDSAIAHVIRPLVLFAAAALRRGLGR